MFCEFYAEVSFHVFDDKKFLSYLEQSWAASELKQYDDLSKETETLVAAIRQNLIKKSNKNHSEEFVLREMFRKYDLNGNGVLSKDELALMLD